MQLSQDGFWGRVYRWSRLLWIAFSGYCGDARLYNTDLCTFVRTIFVWAPLVVAINLGVIGFGLYAAGNLLVMLWLEMSLVGAFVLFIVAIAALAATVYFLGWGGSWAFFAIRKSETAHIAAEYIKAKKSSICPLISFKGGADASV